MIRPCTWKGETFDAIRVKRVLNTGNGVTICLNMGQSFILQCDANDVDSLYFEAITTIAEALDEPVLATEAVLAGLPKNAKIILTDIEDVYLGDTPYACMTSIGHIRILVEDFTQKVYIKSNGCPKTAEYLRQFTLDGVRIKEKETSHDSV